MRRVEVLLCAEDEVNFSRVMWYAKRVRGLVWRLEVGPPNVLTSVYAIEITAALVRGSYYYYFKEGVSQCLGKY